MKMRARRLSVTMLLIATVAVTPVAATAAAPPDVLAVTPSTGLVDAQKVTITTPAAWATGQGYRPYVLCPTAATAAALDDGCTQLGVSEPGQATTTVAVPALVIIVDENGTVATTDCRTASCSLRALDYDDDFQPEIVAQAPLTFVPGSALRTPPTLTVAPTTGLVDGQSVTATMSPAPDDFDPGSEFFLAWCASPLTTIAELTRLFDDCTYLEPTATANPSGNSVSAEFGVPAYVQTSSGPVDCRAAGSTCTIVALDQVGQFSNVGLGFDPTAPLKPALLARPQGSAPGAPDVFDLIGFTPRDPFTLRWCNDSGACTSDVLASGTLDATGAASVTLSGDEFLESLDIGEICHDGCMLTALDAHGIRAQGGWSVIVDGGPNEPTGPFDSRRLPVQVSAHRDLSDGAVVTVTASGFTPGAEVAIIQCTGQAVSLGAAACDLDTSSYLNGQQITADAHGNVSATYAVHRFIDGPEGRFDCMTGNIDPDAYLAGVAADPSREGMLEGRGYSTCLIGVANIGDYSESGGVPIAFTGARFKPLPWQVVPPAPTVTPIAASTPPARPVAAQPPFTG